MAVTVTISGVPYAVLEQTISVDLTSDGRSVATFTVKDLTGTVHFQPGQPVTIIDSIQGYHFSSYINDSQETPYPPTACIVHAINCIDGHYIADKRFYSGPEYNNRYAGDIAADLIQQVLAGEGVISTGYAVDNDHSQADWAVGTLTGVTAANNVSGGDLELSPAGTATIISESGSVFSTGTVGNTQVSTTPLPSTTFPNMPAIQESALGQKPFNAIKLTGTQSLGNGGNTYVYVEIADDGISWHGGSPYVVPSGAYFSYSVFIVGSAPQAKIALDVVFTDGTTLRSSTSVVDEQGVAPHPGNDLTGLATGQWYFRSFYMGAYAGKGVSYITAAIEGDTGGVYTGYFKDIFWGADWYGGTIWQYVFHSATMTSFASTGGGQTMQNNGYSAVVASVVPCYDPYDYRWTPSYPISQTGIVASTNVVWSSVQTAKQGSNDASKGSVIEIGYSLDAGNSYIFCTNGAPLPDFPGGLSTAGLAIQFIQFLTSNISNPEDTPYLTAFEFQANPGYLGTKVDTIYHADSPADWNAGTYFNTDNNVGGGYNLELSGYTRNWNVASGVNGAVGNQTVYGASGPAHASIREQLGLTSGTNADVRSRFDFAGSAWQNFTAEIDVTLQGGSVGHGLVYRCSNWGNANDSYAYSATLSTTQVLLAHGTNSSGAGAFTSIATAAVTLKAGDTHRLKIIVNGNSHQVYVNDVQYISVSDSTYAAAGYIGARFYNNTGTMTLNRQVTSGTAYHSIDLNDVDNPIADGQALTIGAETVYAYGLQNASTAKTTTVAITTNSAGSTAAQADWTPAATHAVGTSVTFPSTLVGMFDNFGVVAFLSGTWTSPVISLNASSAYFNSDIYFGNGNDPTNATVTCALTTNGGSTWTAVNNPSALIVTSTGLPYFSAGQSLVGVNLQIKITLTSTTATVLPNISAFWLKILGSFSATASRVTEGLSLDGVGVVQSAQVSWVGIQPLNAAQQAVTGVYVDTSLDNATWTSNVAPGESTDIGSTTFTGFGPIAGIITPSAPIIDDFSEDTSLDYINTYQQGGSAATWTWNSALNQLAVSGGSNAVLLYGAPVITADVDVSAIIDQSDNAGLVWRWLDPQDYYQLSIHDASSGNTPNTVKLYSVVGNVTTQIGATVSIAFTRGTPHTFRAIMTGNAITVTMDGATIIATTDNSLSAAGYAGPRNNTHSGSSGQFYLLRIAYAGQNVNGLKVYTRIRLTSTDPTITPQVLNLSTSVRNGNIQDGILIPAANYSIMRGSKMTLAAIMDDLCTQSGNYWWDIVAGQLYFQSQQSVPAPFPITGADVLVENLKFDNINDAYRNSMWVTNGKDALPYEDSFIGDTVKTTFDVSFDIESMTALSVNGVQQTFGLKGVDTGRQWYWTPGAKTITQDTTTSLPLNGTQTLLTSYKGIMTIQVNVTRPSEIARVAAIDGTSGIVEEGVVSSAHKGKGANKLTKQACIQLALGYLDKYARKSTTATFDTLTPGLTTGQLLAIFNVMGRFAAAFLIMEVKINWKTVVQNGVSTVTPWYSVTAVSGPVVGDFTRFVANLNL